MLIHANKRASADFLWMCLLASSEQLCQAAVTKIHAKISGTTPTVTVVWGVGMLKPSSSSLGFQVPMAQKSLTEADGSALEDYSHDETACPQLLEGYKIKAFQSYGGSWRKKRGKIRTKLKSVRLQIRFGRLLSFWATPVHFHGSLC